MDSKDLTKEYTNGEVTIVWKNALCKHAAECVKNNPEVFKPKEKPWIHAENSTTEKIIETIKKSVLSKKSVINKRNSVVNIEINKNDFYDLNYKKDNLKKIFDYIRKIHN